MEVPQKGAELDLNKLLEARLHRGLKNNELEEFRQSLIYISKALMRWHQINHGKNNY